MSDEELVITTVEPPEALAVPAENGEPVAVLTNPAAVELSEGMEEIMNTQGPRSMGINWFDLIMGGHRNGTRRRFKKPTPRSDECVAQLKADAEIKRARKRAKRLSDLAKQRNS